MRLAYLVNQYPHTSHSFIRREIAALQSLGIDIQRISIRRPRVQLVDPADRDELAQTDFILDVGASGLLWAGLCRAVSSPTRFLSALRLACSVSRRAPRGLLWHLIYLMEACVVLRWLLRRGAAHVHAHFGTNSTTVAMLCRVLGGPGYSFTVHGPEEFDRPEMLSLTEKIHRAEFVVAISEFGRSQLYRWSPHEHWHKIHVVRCGLDQRFLVHSDLPIPPEPRLVCVGRLSEQKGQLVLVEAAARLAAANEDFQIELIGDGDMRLQIEQFIRVHHLEERVSLSGWRSGDAVRAAILGSRALVLPSFAEGLPVVIMEALALGRPVISTYVAGIPELVEPGKSGWLVPAGSADDLVAAMREALKSPVDRLEAMGRHGAARVAERHCAATEAAKLAQLFATATGAELRLPQRAGQGSAPPVAVA